MALALALANHYSPPAPAPPRQLNSTDWLQSLPPTPGAHMTIDLPEALELMNYSGFRVFARFPKIEVKPGQALYYVRGTHVYEGPPNRRRLVRSTGLGLKDIVAAGGSVALADLPDGFEYTVFFRHDEANGGVSGFERFGFVDPTHHGRETGGSPFTIKLTPNNGGSISGLGFEVELGKEIEVGEFVSTPMDAKGSQDDEHATTVRWFFALQVAPRAF